MKKNNLLIFLVIFILILVIFLVNNLLPSNDPDLGYHIRIGERYWQEKHLPDSNWYNYAFPESKWIPHEINGELLIYGIYSLGKFVSLSVFFTLLMLLIAYLIFVKFKDKYSSWITHVPLAFLTFYTLSQFAGVRLQLFSWLGFCLVYLGYFAWKNKKPWPFWLWFLIFVIWANVHNSLIFIIGIVFLFFSLNLLFNSKGRWIYWLKLLPILIFSTFLQPITYKVYIEFFRTLTDQYKVNIAEWQPTNINHDAGLLLILSYTLFFIILLFVDRKDILKIDFPLFLITIIMMFLGYMNVRNIPLALISLLPVASTALSTLVGQIKWPEIKNKLIYLPLITANIILIVLLALAINQNYKTISNPKLLAEKGNYPYGAVEYLKKNGFPKGNVFNDYGWGGFLIYNFPNYKWFIDGRLPHIKVNDPTDSKKQITGLKLYNKVSLVGTDINQVLNYYQIQWFIVKNNTTLTTYLKNTGWKVKYSDSQVGIYYR